MEDKNWLVSLAERKPSPALVLGMYIVIGALTTSTVYLFMQLGSIREETQSKTQADDAKVKAASDSVYLAIIRDKNTELKDLKAYNKDCKTEVDKWVERFIQTADATAEKQEKDLKERIQKFEAVVSKSGKISAQRESLLKRSATDLNTLEQIKNHEN